MTRADMVRLALLLMMVVLVMLTAYQARGHQPTPEPKRDDAAFRPFPTYVPSPTPIIGLHEYGVPLRSEPTASPSPERASRPTATPASDHTSSGSGTRTIRRPNHNLIGKASWYATGRSGPFAAACRPLRQAMGPDWRGKRVLVSYKRRAIEVVLNDFCASRDKTIDLSDEAFRYLAPLSRGVLRVAVGW